MKASLTGSTEDIGLSNAEATRFRDTEVRSRNLLGNIGDSLEIIREFPDANTFVANAARIANNLQSEANALAGVMGTDIDLFNPDNYDFELSDELGLVNEDLKGITTAIAFQAASVIADQEGRSVSDKDVKRFIQMVGADAADPRAIERRLLNVANQVDRSFRNNHKVRLGTDFTGDLGLESLGAKSQTEVPVTELSDEELFK